MLVVFVWVFSLLVVFCNGFATIDEFAKVLDVFKDTKFHDNQLLSALCITQYEFLKRHKSFKGKKPEFYEECPYDEWHKSNNSSSKALFDVDELDSIRDEFESAVAAPDLRSMKPTEHFDIESFITETNVKLLKDRKNLLRQMKADGASFSDIREKLGEMLHTVQDFYSHTNWVELGNDKINPMVGMGSNLGVKLNGEHDIACKPCDNSFTDEEQKEVDDAFGGLLTGIPLRIVGRKDNVYSCRGNMVTKFLTSGYYESEKDFKAMPEGKCTHGGLTDNYGGDGPTVGGINKDAATVLMSPHYYLHHIAANLSVKATIKYFEDIRNSLSDERLFGKLIGIEITAGSSKAASATAFVIDTTGSMASSIENVKIFAEKVIEKEKNDTFKFFLTPFNDPEHGPVKTFTDPQQAIAAVKELNAIGGGALSEKMYAALLETARKVPEGTAIYVFTDSASKNCRLLASIKSIAAKKNLQINFFMPGFTKKPRRTRRAANLHRCETEESIDDYRRLALSTNGQFVVAFGENLQKAADTLTDSNWQRLKMFSNVNTPFNKTIDFDNTVTEVEISMNAAANENLNTVAVDIVDANDTNIVRADNILISNAYSKVFRFNNTDGSPWTITIDGNNQSIAQIDIKVKSNVSANVMITDSDTKKSVRGALKPGQKYDITITCASCSEISKLVIAQCGGNTPIMPPQTPEKCGRANKWCVKDIKLPPVSGDNQFCISYAGKYENDDTMFERIAAQKLSTSALNLNTTFSTDNNATDDPGEVFPNDNITINYSIENLGESDDEVILKVTSSIDLPMKYYKDPIKIGKGEKALGNIYITANAAAGSMIDLEICATSKSDPSQHSSDDYTVFVTDPEADLDAPECIVDYSTVSACPKDPKDCENSTYVVLLSFKDVDSGVSTVNYPRGQWQITDRHLFHSSYAVNHTFYAMGVFSCCDDAEFNVMDKEHLIGQCTLDVYHKTPVELTAPQTSSSPSISTSMIKISIVFVFCLSFFF